MAPFSFVSVGANLLVKSLGLFPTASAIRCSCIVPTLRHFSTASEGPPKRPLTAYMRFVKEQRPIIIQQNPDVKVVDVIRKIAAQWRILTPEQKRPFEHASAAAREQYKVAMERFQAQLTPAQSAAMAEEKRQKMAKRKVIRKKRELNNLGKPKRPRTPFNVFMAEHFKEAKGSTTQGKMKSLMEDWKDLNVSQQQVYVQLAEDDKVRYKNEMKAWEEHMSDLGRDDLIRRKEKTRKKTTTKKKSSSSSQVKVLKAKAPSKKKLRPATKKRQQVKVRSEK